MNMRYRTKKKADYNLSVKFQATILTPAST